MSETKVNDLDGSAKVGVLPSRSNARRVGMCDCALLMHIPGRWSVRCRKKWRYISADQQARILWQEEEEKRREAIYQWKKKSSFHWLTLRCPLDMSWSTHFLQSIRSFDRNDWVIHRQRTCQDQSRWYYCSKRGKRVLTEERREKKKKGKVICEERRCRTSFLVFLSNENEQQQ